jgi:hypothetical protein
MASMTGDFTKRAVPAWEAHPLYRFWKTLRDSPNVSALRAALYRPREGLTYAPAKLYVHAVLKDGTQRDPGEYGWDPIANEGLVRLGGRCVEQSDEVMRFALMAQNGFLPIEGRVGDAYFNSVLLERMRLEPFSRQPSLEAMLARVGRDYKASPGEARDDCVRQIDNAISELSKDLVAADRLAYDNVLADTILDKALAQYVDERFSVTNRQMLGWAR